MLGSATPFGLIDTFEVKHAWATYFVKFIDAYQSLGVPIWGVTVQV